jgi:flagellar assembly protein FliH
MVSKVIRGEQGDAFDRWQLPTVGQPAAAAQAPAQPAPTVRELEELQKAAYDEGFAQGRKEGFDKGNQEGVVAGQQEGRELVQRMRRILDALAEPVRQLDDDVEQALTSLALSIAQQVIRRELTVQPGEVVAVVREAVALLPLSAREVSVRLHPEDARFIRETLKASDEASAWKLVEDPAITRGGCRVATPSSQVDATLERRLAILASDLLGGGREVDGGAA